METVKIRKYTSDDYVSVCRLMSSLQSHFASIDTTGESRDFASEDEAREYINKGLKDVQEMNGACFVAESEGEVVGFIQGIVDTHEGQVMHTLGHNPGTDGWIGLLMVDLSYRKKGIGKRLIESMKQFFLEKKCKRMRLKVMSDNTETIRVYEKLGFTPRDIEMAIRLI